jgi:hypothetical protein
MFLRTAGACLATSSKARAPGVAGDALPIDFGGLFGRRQSSEPSQAQIFCAALPALGIMHLPYNRAAHRYPHPASDGPSEGGFFIFFYRSAPALP